MAYVHRTLIAPANIIDAARNIGDCLNRYSVGMFLAPMSANGEAPATFYASAGLIEEAFLPPLSDPNILYSAAQYGAGVQNKTLWATLQDCEALLSEGDVSDEPWEVAAERLGLKLVSEQLDQEALENLNIGAE